MTRRNPNHVNNEINSLFINYRRSIINTWRDYNYLDYSTEELKRTCEKDPKSVNLTIGNLYNKGTKTFYSKDIWGMTERILKTSIPSRTLIQAVSQTEHFLQDLTKIVYKEFPEKIASRDSVEQIGQQVKLMSTIMESDSKEEMIDKLIEEKIRGIFYGKPTDFFEKDKAKIGLGSVFKEDYSNALSKYLEITGRRNIWIHNSGKVDRKYKRENPSSTDNLGSKLNIDRVYLKESIILLKDISGMTTKLVMTNNFGATKFHKFLNSSINQFEKKFKD